MPPASLALFARTYCRGSSKSMPGRLTPSMKLALPSASGGSATASARASRQSAAERAPKVGSRAARMREFLFFLVPWVQSNLIG